MTSAQNAANADCEPIDATKCNQALISSKMCDGWTQAAYNDTEHEYIFDATRDCYRYMCKQSGYAFVSDKDHKCVECVTDKRNGVHPESGNCIKCAPGQIFNQKDTSNFYCSVAIGLTKSDLMYGRGKTKGSNSDLSKQCWIQTDAKTYRDCVMNGGMSDDTTKKNTIDAQKRDAEQ